MTCLKPVRILLATLLGAIVLAVATAPADAAVSLSATGDARFPEREYVLTLPEHSRLTDGQVQVSENAKPVRGLRVAPVGADRRAKLGVVLAIDASSSMRGRAFEEAFDAARAFARERNGRQPFALVTFGSGSRLALPFTNDEGQIHDAMHNPGTPSGGTHMYDAALRSVEARTQLRSSGRLRRGAFGRNRPWAAPPTAKRCWLPHAARTCACTPSASVRIALIQQLLAGWQRGAAVTTPRRAPPPSCGRSIAR